MASQTEVFLKALSRLLGWMYVLCWSASFYPQPILNYRRRSTRGLAIDFPTTNLLGFVCYLLYTSAFLYSPTIRAQYAARHPLSPDSSVRFNDFAFALHAVVLSGLVYSQFFPRIWGFSVSSHQRASRVVLGVVAGSFVSVILLVMLVVVRNYLDSDPGSGPGSVPDPQEWAWIDVLYAVSYIKLLVTVIKYIPQAWVNYKRKSTVGWSIVQILLDLSGGILSVLQLVIDSGLEADWSGVTGNPVKFGLGNVSVFFDLLFVVQHYILYRDDRKRKEAADDGNAEDGLVEPLLGRPEP